MNIEVSKSLEFKREIIKDCSSDKNLLEEMAALAAVKANEVAKEAIENAIELSQYLTEDKVVFKVSVQILNSDDDED